MPRVSAVFTVASTPFDADLPSPIDAQRLPGHERSALGREKGDGGCNLVGRAEAPYRDRLGALAEPDFEVVSVFAPIGRDRARSADRAGADRVDRDPERRQVERKG